MQLENLTGEIEDWLERVEEEENLKFIRQMESKPLEGTVAIEMLGYYGSVDRMITKEIQKLSQNTRKLAGFFSSYFNEMVQMYSGEILLPITILQTQIGSKDFILTTSNFAIPDVISYRLAEELYRFYKKQRVSKIYLVDGAYNYKRNIKQKPQVHKITSSEFQIRVTNEKLANFTLMGQIASSFLTYWSYNGDIPIEILVVDAFSDYDPISSLELLKVLTKQWEIEADFNELEKRSQEFIHLYKQSKKEIHAEEQKVDFDPRFFV
ncbi:MAG: PAC2 family protein [Candidatus Heimdallarchaeota archaeon]|nr:MAG: PAC2 family protein [Candidatus Heimdallarchaeota archaeon]